MKFILSILLITSISISNNGPFVVVLGIAQDGGAPHANCQKFCCKNLWDGINSEKVSSIGVINPKTGESWIIDATPDFPAQHKIITHNYQTQLAGIFLTHAHIGHYTGLIYLGREVMGAKMIPVFIMPKMKSFLESNGPWNQLVSLENIELITLRNNRFRKLADDLFIEPFLVPHRDEYSETVGYKIMGPNASLLYIPDIDKWEKWDQEIFEVIQHVDVALIDGTFFSQDEIPHRDMNEIPHPFITETMKHLFNLNTSNRNKIYFTHFNHSNPAIRDGAAVNQIRSNRFNVAREGIIFDL
ncbi:MAG: pyrroloquinoline quinone biosynthesis protein PqqB [Candidatus Marinimicrobia bacterium]|nr:pyrroloquinoline quinone biosynthesis protein PqqB [Candidatus Neomarinimicrobiota bacterium]